MINLDSIVEKHLVKEIRSFDARDDSDAPFFNSFFVNKEFSTLNKIALKKKFLSIKNECKSILEIGIHRNNNDSSTMVFLDNKNDNTFYFGIDIEDKSYLDNAEKNIYTIKTDSTNLEEIMQFVNSKNVFHFDFIFIDGWHSINQVLKDWRFTDYLSNIGIVGLHDTNSHPGPYLVTENINDNIWELNKQCTTRLSDWGISFLTKK